MQLIEIYLPVYDAQGGPFPGELYTETRDELVDRFGGLTAHALSPVVGLWKDKDNTERDQIIIYEIIADRMERSWWSNYKKSLEQRFSQKSMLIRANEITIL